MAPGPWDRAWCPPGVSKRAVTQRALVECLLYAWPVQASDLPPPNGVANQGCHAIGHLPGGDT